MEGRAYFEQLCGEPMIELGLELHIGKAFIHSAQHRVAEEWKHRRNTSADNEQIGLFVEVFCLFYYALHDVCRCVGPGVVIDVLHRGHVTHWKIKGIIVQTHLFDSHSAEPRPGLGAVGLDVGSWWVAASRGQIAHGNKSK